MNEITLRKKVIRLAHTNPKLRHHLLPFLNKNGKDAKPPKKVQEIAKDVEEKGGDPGLAYAVAWSVYCVAGDTLVFTDRGILPISQATPHRYKPINLRVPTDNGINIASHGGVTNEHSPIMRLRTKDGWALKATNEHKILTLSRNDMSLSWKKMGELTVGDLIAIKVGAGIWPNEPTNLSGFVSSIQAHNAQKCDPPAMMNPPLARLLGYIVSEGSVTEDRITISNMDPDVLSDMKSCCERVFGKIPGGIFKHGNCQVVSMWHKDACDFLRYCGLNNGRAQDKKVPWSILQGTQEHAVAFLKGLYEGDGFAGNRIELATMSERLAGEVSLLLLNLGIYSRIRQHSTNKCFQAVVHGGRSRSKFMEKVGFVTEKKQKAHNPPSILDRACQEDMIPGSSFFLRQILDEKKTRKRGGWYRLADGSTSQMSFEPLTKSDISLNALERHPQFMENLKRISPEAGRKIEILLKMGVAWDTVSSVKSLPDLIPVYDLTVPERECFIANGIIIHNCKYKEPGSPHCHRPPSGYFPGRK